MNDKPWPAPAKINLFLHITGRRADGYHLLQTAFQFLDYCDWLSFTPRQDGRIRHLNPLAGVPVETDLTVRAAQRLREAVGRPELGVEIGIDKRLPMGGGLGGGSSDAATTLVALNRLWGLGLETDRLAGLGLALGADVPVFVRGRAAWAEGVGERLTPLEGLPQPWYLVITPACQVSTAAIFNHPELTRDQQPIKIAAFLSGQGINVCEPLVRALYPEVDAALTWLGQYAPARMSGTGASVFAAFGDERGARAVLAQLPSQWRGFVARGMNESPLLKAAASSK